ncbi:TraB/GumN family protein [Brevundimonas sp.]
MMTGSGTAFIAVGAAHLMDNDNVIDMLKAKGFTVERL